jgi:hypothetical protein
MGTPRETPAESKCGSRRNANMPDGKKSALCRRLARDTASRTLAAATPFASLRACHKSLSDDRNGRRAGAQRHSAAPGRIQEHRCLSLLHEVGDCWPPVRPPAVDWLRSAGGAPGVPASAPATASPGSLVASRLRRTRGSLCGPWGRAGLWLAAGSAVPARMPRCRTLETFRGASLHRIAVGLDPGDGGWSSGLDSRSGRGGEDSA